MELEEHPSKRTRVWLTADEILRLTDVPPVGSKKWTAVNLLARGGVKLNELLSLKRKHVTVDGAQAAIQFSGSGIKPTLRKCPIPEPVAYTVLAYDEGEIFDITTRTARRWIKRQADTLAAETGDPGWQKVSPVDLRRSWADVLLLDGVPPELVMRWGGWDSPDVFQEMFLSRHSTKSSLTEASRSEIY